MDGHERSEDLDEFSRMNNELVTLQRELIRNNRDLLEAQDELRASEERYRSLLHVVPQLIWTCDRYGECSFVGGEWNLYGEEERTWTNWFEAVAPVDRERTREVWRKAIDNHTPFDIEHRIIGRQGERWFMTRGVHFQEKEGEEKNWVLSSTDITDLITTRDALSDEREKLSASLEEHAESERLADMRAQIAMNLARNEKLVEILQQTAEIVCDEIGAAFVRIWVLKRGGQVLRLRASAGMYTHLDGEHSLVPVGKFKIGRIAASGQPHLSNNVPDDPEVGDREWARREGLISFAGFPLVVEDRVVGVVALFARYELSDRLLPELSLVADGLAQFIDRKRIDRERRKRVSDLLRAQEEIETLNDVGRTLSAELDTKVLAQKVTDAATKLSGASLGAFFYNVVNPLGESYSLYTISGVDPSAFSGFPMPRKTQIFAPTFEGAGIVRSDDITKDARYGHNPPYSGMPEGHLPVRSYLAVPVISSRSGEVIGGLFFGHPDVAVFTDREERIVASLASQASIAMDNARMFSHLEDKVQERTARLQESIGELEAFSYTVSHDLRAPLRVMQSYAQIIREDFGPTLDPSALHYLDRIAGAATRLDRLIQDLLTYSRISRANLRMASIELEPIIDEVLTSYPVFTESEADVIIQEPLPRVVGDLSSLTQCFSNLIGNGVKFVPKGRRPEIRIAGDIEGDHVVITVADNGIGIPEEHQEKIFRIFERATVSGEYEGTGIGLAIVRKAMERMGGSINVSSDEGKGSTFALRFHRPPESGRNDA